MCPPAEAQRDESMETQRLQSNSPSTPQAVTLAGYENQIKKNREIEKEMTEMDDESLNQPASVRNNVNCSLALKKTSEQEMVSKVSCWYCVLI